LALLALLEYLLIRY